MHGTIPEAIKRVAELKTKIRADLNIDVAVAPSFTALSSVEIALQGSEIALAAQNCHWDDEGAYTGEISVHMLKDIGCRYVLLGHSERRHSFGESNEFVGKKVRTVIHNEMTPIFCVGETSDERKQNKTFAVIDEQLRRGISGLGAEEISQMVLAYEPVWAIGTGETATPQQAQEVHQYLRNYLSKSADKPTANAVRILYGGSVKPTNTAELVAQADIDGLLVGGASLDAGAFAEIILKANESET